jgi:DnaK suppressor protein
LEQPVIELEEEAQKASISKPYDKLDENGKIEIEQIDLALIKMSVGDYGVCESCGDDISPKRLQVIPWARLCVECARDYEKQHRSLPQTTEAVVSGKTPDEYQGLTNEQIVSLILERLQTEEKIDTEELRIAFRKGVVFLDGTLESEADRDFIVQVLTDSMGFSSIVDRVGINELSVEREDISDGAPEPGGFDSSLFYDRGCEDAFETKGICR